MDKDNNFKNYKNSSVYDLLFFYMKEYKWSTLFFIAFGIFWAFTLPYMSYLFGTIIDQIQLHGIQTTSVFKLVAIPLGLYVAIHVLRSIGYYAHGLFSIFSVLNYKESITNKLFNHLGRQSIGYFEAKKTGFLANKITNVNISFVHIIFNIFGIIFPQSLAILLTGILLSIVVPYFGLVLWIWGIGIIIYTYRSSKVGHKKSLIFADACSIFNGHVVDVVSNMQAVINNATISYESKLLDNNIKNLVQKERDRDLYANKVMFVQHIAMNTLVAFYLIGSLLGYDYNLVSIGEVVFVMTSVTAIAGLTSSLGKCFLDLVYNIGLFKDGLSLLEDVPDVSEKKDARHHVITKGNININNISFSYPGTSTIIFDNFSLAIPAKQKIGIVGSSGGGKTTLIKLLMRLYDVTSGNIEIDGINITDYTKSSLRTQIAVVSQHLNLFHRSIMENISYGCGDVDKEAVIDAAKKANCHDFIMSLENQYDTIIGEQGIKLSGGQRQRIAIARAILKNAPILFLDEATSALDSTTEKAIQQSLKILLQDKTAIVIAHRLSTLKAMDKIVVIEKGKIVENGTHNELLDVKGAYYNYWTHQSEGFIK